MASLAFCVALAMMTSAISSIAEATDAGDWYVDLGKSENSCIADEFFIIIRRGNAQAVQLCIREYKTCS